MCVDLGVCVCIATETLTEAEEEGVHTHVVHAEEAVSDEVRTDGHRLKENHRNSFRTKPSNNTGLGPVRVRGSQV